MRRSTALPRQEAQIFHLLNLNYTMCQTATISSTIVRLSKRSFAQQLNAMQPTPFEGKRSLARLNNDLDNLYDDLYEAYHTVTEDDYKVIGPYLRVLIRTLNDLHSACKKAPSLMGLRPQTERLAGNISAICEVNNDIVRYKIRLPKDPEMKAIMHRVSKAMHS